MEVAYVKFPTSGSCCNRKGGCRTTRIVMLDYRESAFSPQLVTGSRHYGGGGTAIDSDKSITSSANQCAGPCEWHNKLDKKKSKQAVTSLQTHHVEASSNSEFDSRLDKQRYHHPQLITSNAIQCAGPFAWHNKLDRKNQSRQA